MRKLLITTCLLLVALTVVSAQERPQKRERSPEQLEQRKALRSELRTYNQEEIKPILQAARGQLDKKISAEDQASLERLRKALKPERTGEKGKKGERGDRHAARTAYREAHATELAELEALATKYATELDQLRERLAPQFATWEAERKAIRERYRPESTEARKDKPGKSHRGEGHRKGKNTIGARFLLMKA